MGLGNNKIKWDHVDKWVKKAGSKVIWKCYGLPEVLDIKTSAFADIDPMPRWQIPDKVFISVAITGAFISQRANPNQPVTPSQIRDSADECLKAGATTVHIHVRDKNGLNVLDPELFKEVISPLRERHPDAVIDGCLVAVSDDEDRAMVPVMRSGLLDALPVNPTAMCCGDNMFYKPPHALIEKTRQTLDAGLIPQIAVYTDGDIDNARRYLVQSGLVDKPCYWLILPALPGCSPMHSPQSMVDGLMRMVRLIREIDEFGIIAVCASGRASTYLATQALILGLHVRVGMEDTPWKWPHKEDMLKSSVEHFHMVADIARSLGREVMTPTEYRKLIGLPAVRKTDKSLSKN